MDIQQYIASGIIEAYVLGITSDEEARELESLSARYPEIAAAVADYRQALETFSALHQITPPEDMKEQIWSVLEKEQETKNAEQGIVNGNNIVPFAVRGKKKNRTAALAAAIALLIGSLILNFIFWNRSRSTEAEIASMKTEQKKMETDNQGFKQQLEQARQHFRLLLDPAVKSITLTGVGEHTAHSAMVLWDSRSKEVYLSLKDMPPPPPGKQYQLWAMVDGKPVDAGVYVLQQKDAMQKMKVIPEAQMFAITLEKEGGSEAPTLEEMYAAGKI